jgi:DNA repair ATPase RecN
MYSTNQYINSTQHYNLLGLPRVTNEYPQAYTFLLKNIDNNETPYFARQLILVSLIIILHYMIRACMDPFTTKLSSKIEELENALKESNEAYDELYNEYEENILRIEELEKKLKEYETLIESYKNKFDKVDSPFLVVSNKRKIQVDTKLEDAF